jgi:hypothetical protein
MGFSADIMHDFVVKEIRNIYSSYDGWNCTKKETGNGYDAIAVLERHNGGHRECAKILVSFARDFATDYLEELRAPVKSYDGTPTRQSFAVMLPANANMASVPAGLPVLTMRSFAFEGKDLIWVKKPVKKEDAAKAAA